MRSVLRQIFRIIFHDYACVDKQKRMVCFGSRQNAVANAIVLLKVASLTKIIQKKMFASSNCVLYYISAGVGFDFNYKTRT